MSGFSRTDELALEQLIERKLTGYTREGLTEQRMFDAESEVTPERSGDGYVVGHPHNYDKKHALDTKYFWQFLESTQPEELKKVQRQSDWKEVIIGRFDRLIKRYGILELLKGGLKINDADITLFYQPPTRSSGKRVKENFEKNIFSITRQVHYSKENPMLSIDLVLFINGMAVSTMELKNQWTGQRASIHGINQYKNTRDTRETLFNFARCIVHFAVDTDEVFMTTKLQGEKTFFSPSILDKMTVKEIHQTQTDTRQHTYGKRCSPERVSLI